VDLSFALITAITSLVLGTASEPPSLQSLLDRIPLVAQDSDGVGKEEHALAEQIQAHRAAAIPHLLPLLESETKAVRTFAGYVLRDLEGLTEEHLEALIRARRRGDGWIPPAIARIGTPRAISFLVEDLEARPQSSTQVTWGLVRAGGKAATELAEAFGAVAPLSEAFVRATSEVLHEMGGASGHAVAPLLSVATGPSSSTERKVQALQALGCIGLPAESAVPALQELRAREGALRDAVDSTLIGIGTPAAVPILVERLRAKPSVVLLRDIAEFRERGHDAGPAVVELLSSGDWELRVASATTLGYIQYTPATAVLLTLLEDDTDWRRVFASAESLGRLRANRALRPLERVAVKHWYPPVRVAALKAMNVIRGKEAYVEAKNDFASEFFSYESVSLDNPATFNPPLVQAPEELSASALERLAYDAEVVGFGEDGEQVTPVRQHPDCGLHVSDGYLLGADRGEWGGELMHLHAGSNAKKLLDTNTLSIHRLGKRIIAVTGLAHITLNEGMLYQLIPQGSSFVAEPWRALPGAPRRSGLLADGRLFVSCQGGDIIVTSEGRIELANP
jgi:HEAT repeat protein